MNTIIGVCGIGVVGSAIAECFENKNINVIKYDKYNNNSYDNIDKLLVSDIIFLCLPTTYSDEKKEYDKSSLTEVCSFLVLKNYTGIVVIKSTIEPGSCRNLKNKFNLNILHNPEFLSMRTAKKDFENQNHIVIGGDTNNDKNISSLLNFYKKYWVNAEFSLITYEESELMKIGVNCFYSVKIQFFNELYKLTNTYENASYNIVIETKNVDMNMDMIDLPLREAREIFEKQYLSNQLIRFDHNITKMAMAIGMERSALHRKLKTLEITQEDDQNS